MFISMDPSLLCRVFFVLGAAVSLGGTLLPSFRIHIMNYGSRGSTHRPSISNTPKGLIDQALELTASLQVPHSWFTHYYIISVLSSLFWGHQIHTQGIVIKFLLSHSTQRDSSMTANQVVLTWLLMFIQGGRRLFESVTLAKPSQSRMWIGLWVIGMGYYIFMGVSVWIEGIDLFNERASIVDLLVFSRPSLKTFVAVPLFIVASSIQHKCHVHLASLKKYTLPEMYLFRLVVCPHYTSESLIYLALAIISAPKGQALNRTILAGLGFVFANLAVTADATREWYTGKFGAAKLMDRKRMIPYVF